MLALTVAGTGAEEDLHVILNMAEAAIDVELPRIADRTWHVAIDTAREPPLDVVERARQMPYADLRYSTNGHSVVVLEARSGRTSRQRGKAPVPLTRVGNH